MFKDPKRSVNLSSKQTLTKQQLLQKNQREREERQLNQLKETCAFKIQKAFKAHKAKLLALRELEIGEFSGNSAASEIAKSLLLNSKINPEFQFDWNLESESR